MKPRAAVFSAVSVPAAYEHVVDRLKRSIQLSEILPGEKLPTERALAESFAVSRLTVREALRTLQGEGLIETRRGKGGGTVVLPAPEAGWTRRFGVADSRDRLEQIHELRMAVEPMAAALAAERGTSEQIETLRRHHEELTSSTDVGSFRRADSNFHLAVAAASGNPFLLQAVEDARSSMFFALDLKKFVIIHSTSAEAHRSILSAIERHDRPAAVDAMEKHLREARAEILQAMSE